jgi:hypothetical protein
MAARALFELQPTDMRQPFGDWESSDRPTTLSALVEQMYREGQTLRANVKWIRPLRVQVLDVEVLPVRDREGSLVGAALPLMISLLLGGRH